MTSTQRQRNDRVNLGSILLVVLIQAAATPIGVKITAAEGAKGVAAR